MAEVAVVVAGRSYALACRDGDEARLRELAAEIAARADRLTATLGAMSEARLLLMSALMIADELHDLRLAQPTPVFTGSDRLLALAEQAERLVATLDTAKTG